MFCLGTKQTPMPIPRFFHGCILIQVFPHVKDPSSSQPSSSKHVKGPSRDHLTGLNVRSAPSAAGTSTQRHSQHQQQRQGNTAQRHPLQQHHRQGNTVQRHPQQQLQRQGTTRHPLPQSNRPRPISNGSHHHRPSTGAKAPTTAMGANKAPMNAVNGTSNNHPVVKKTTSVASNSRPYVSSSSSVQRQPTEQKRAGHVSAKPVMKSAQPSKPQVSCPSKTLAIT